MEVGTEKFTGGAVQEMNFVIFFTSYRSGAVFLFFNLFSVRLILIGVNYFPPNLMINIILYSLLSFIVEIV